MVSFNEWKRSLLDRRGLDAPDARPLYRYRVSAAEFNELEQLLQERIRELQGRFGLDFIAERPGFADLFVLYCAEWWRRRYDGTGYAWEPILVDLGADSRTWNANERSDCVAAGLRGWKLRTSRTGGHKYLGSVAMQGGVPLRLLAEDRGGISRVLGRVLRIAGSKVESPQELEQWVASMQSALPMNYRQGEIYALLAEIAWTVLDLKYTAQLTERSTAISRLDRFVPDWKDRFPLPLEDQHAAALIEHLIREAATVRIDRHALILPVLRTLEVDEDGSWTLSSALALPETIDDRDLIKLFGITDETLPRTAELDLLIGDKVRTAELRRVTGQDKYRISRNPWGTSGKNACEEHLVRLIAADGRVWTAPATKGFALDDSLPWVFSESGEIPRLVRQGSGPITDKRGIVVLPDNWQIRGADECDYQAIGEVKDLERTMFRFEGECVISDGEGNEFRLGSGIGSALEESYEWSGDRLWCGFKSPVLAFRGKPRLTKVDEDGRRSRPHGEPDGLVIGAPSSSHLIGPVQMRFPADGEAKLRSKMVLLPAAADLRTEPSDARSGVYIFEDWYLKDIKVETEGVRSRFVSNQGDSIIELSVPDGSRSPDEVEIVALWPHTTCPARLVLPFPALGVRFFDAGGNELYSGSRIAVQQLIGTRLVVLGASDSSNIELRIRATTKDISRRYVIRKTQESLSIVLRPADYRKDIEHLQAIDDDPDSTATMELFLDRERAFELEISPYQFSPRIDPAEIWIDQISESFDPDLYSHPQAHAIRLENPGEEAITLSPIDSDAGIGWEFDPDDLEPGNWLIYPPEGSDLYFRPTKCYVPGEQGELNPFQVAISTQDETERYEKIDALIAELSSNFEHENWRDIEQLAGHVGHLRLATLDVWKRFARSSRGMAALYFRYSGLDKQFLFRFAQELPFAWETVCAGDWREAISGAIEQCKKALPLDVGEKVACMFVENRMDELIAETGATHLMFGILRSIFSDKARIEAWKLKMGGRRSGEFLFKGATSPLNHLRQRHYADDAWPSELWGEVKRGFADPTVSAYFFPDRLGNPDSTINLPLLLAVQVCRKETSKWFEAPHKIHQLRQYMNFDRDWFEEAFNHTVLRCFAADLLDFAL